MKEKEIIPMNYNAPENILALDVYEQLIPYYQKRSIGKLVATMYHIDTHPLEDGSLRVQGYIETSEFIKIMQGDSINMCFRINGDKTEIWCCIIDPFFLRK